MQEDASDVVIAKSEEVNSTSEREQRSRGRGRIWRAARTAASRTACFRNVQEGPRVGVELLTNPSVIGDNKNNPLLLNKTVAKLGSNHSWTEPSAAVNLCCDGFYGIVSAFKITRITDEIHGTLSPSGPWRI